MNILKFLKSTAGAINKMGVLSLTVAGGMLAFQAYNYANETPAAQEEEIRSLATALASGQVPAEYRDYANRRAIQISTGNAEFATAEERAAHEGYSRDGGDSAVEALGALDGMAALAAGEKGLGAGANKLQTIKDGSSSASPTYPDGSEAGAAAAAQVAQREASGPRLQNAAMARASGSNLNTSGTGGFGNSSAAMRGGNNPSNAGNGIAGERDGRIGTGSISGSMRNRSTFVSVPSTLQGATSSSFRPGNVNAQGAASKKREELNNLKGLAKDYAEMADKVSKFGAGTNEVADPLQNGRRKTGLQFEEFEGMVTKGGDMGDDAGTDNWNNQEQNNQDGWDDSEETIDNWSADHEALWNWLLGAFAGTILAGYLIKAAAKLSGWWGEALKWAAFGAAALALLVFLAKAVEYMSKYKGVDVLGMTCSLSAVAMIAALLNVTLGTGKSDSSFVERLLNKVSDGVNKLFGNTGGTVGGLVKNAALGTAVYGVGQFGKTGINHLDSNIHDGRMANNDAGNGDASSGEQSGKKK